MLTKDPNTLLQLVLRQNLKQTTPAVTIEGVQDAVILDTHLTNPRLPLGTARVTIAAQSPTTAYGPATYPGVEAPPAGTKCFVAFIGSGINDPRILGFVGWQPSFLVSIGGTGTEVEGGSLYTLDASGNFRNELDDGTGNGGVLLDYNVGQDLTVVGDATVGGDLTVTGASNLQVVQASSVVATGDITSDQQLIGATAVIGGVTIYTGNGNPGTLSGHEGDLYINKTGPSLWQCEGGSTWTETVVSFNTRTGTVTLTKADVTGTGLVASDVGAIPTSARGSSSGTGVAELDTSGQVPTAELGNAVTAFNGSQGNITFNRTSVEALGDSGWTTISFIGGTGWASNGSPNSTNCQFRKLADGLVIFEGAIVGPASSNNVTILPPGYRPDATKEWTLSGEDGSGTAPIRCYVAANGTVSVVTFGTPSIPVLVNLDGIFFYAA